nr:helix-turn-helix transcriptional regulator [Oceanococcus sp. HetDA_MAG_MS8]
MRVNALGRKIKELRKASELTLDQLAERSECSKSYIWELENRNPPRPSADKLSKIARQLGTTLDYLLDDDGQINQEDAADTQFFREYQQMPAETKEKFRKMVELWGKE